MNLNRILISNLSAQESDFIKITGNAAAGVYFSAPSFNLSNSSYELSEFTKKYNATFNSLPDIHSIKGYECMKIVLGALKNKKNKPEEIISYIDAKRTFCFAGDTLTFDNNGDVKTNYSVFKYTDSLKVIQMKTINYGR